MQYFDKYQNKDYTVDELTAMLNGQIKPYPQGWYDSEEDTLEYLNSNIEEEFEDAIAYLNSPDGEDDEIDWSQFSMSVNKWENLVRTI